MSNDSLGHENARPFLVNCPGVRGSRQALPDTVKATIPRKCSGRASIRETTAMPDILDRINMAISAEGYSQHDRFVVRLAVEEAIVNAIKHGNRNDARKQVRISWWISAALVELVVADEGAGFDPTRVPDPTAIDNLDRASGRGLLLIRSLMTWVRHSRRGTCLAMGKARSPR